MRGDLCFFEKIKCAIFNLFFIGKMNDFFMFPKLQKTPSYE